MRVSVVGNSGSGKTRLAKAIATKLGIQYIELDALNHLPGWQEIDPDLFATEVARITAGNSWVIDGNYRRVVIEGPVWQRADTVVWLDLPRRTVMRQVIGRTVKRAILRTELWNGNREPMRNLTSWDPNKSILRWAWTQHQKYRDRYSAAMQTPAFAHITFVHLQSHKEADAYVSHLTQKVN